MALSAAMDGSGRKNSKGGGALIAAAIIVGVVAGTISGQSSIGFLAGAGAGILIALLLYLRDRKA